MIVSFWPTQPCIAVMPDRRCVKDTSTATEHAQNSRQRASGSPINKEDAFGLLGNPSRCTEFLRGLGTPSYNSGDVELSNSTHLTLQKCITFFGSPQIDRVSPTSSQA